MGNSAWKSLRKRSARPRSLSTFMPITTKSCDAYSRARLSSQGNDCLQGPHQDAQKSTYTTLPRYALRSRSAAAAAAPNSMANSRAPIRRVFRRGAPGIGLATNIRLLNCISAIVVQLALYCKVNEPDGAMCRQHECKLRQQLF